MDVVSVGVSEELKSLDEQIQSATEVADLKPIFLRVNEIIQASADDFDVQLTANEVKQRLMARGLQLKKQEAARTPAPASEPRIELAETVEKPPAQRLVSRQVDGAAEPATSTPGEAPAATPPMAFVGTGATMVVTFPVFPMFSSARPPEPPPAAPTPFVDAPMKPAETAEAPVMSSPAPSPLPLPEFGSAPLQQPLLELAVAAEVASQPPPPAVASVETTEPAPSSLPEPAAVSSQPASTPAEPPVPQEKPAEPAEQPPVLTNEMPAEERVVRPMATAETVETGSVFQPEPAVAPTVVLPEPAAADSVSARQFPPPIAVTPEEPPAPSDAALAQSVVPPVAALPPTPAPVPPVPPAEAAEPSKGSRPEPAASLSTPPARAPFPFDTVPPPPAPARPAAPSGVWQAKPPVPPVPSPAAVPPASTAMPAAPIAEAAKVELVQAPVAKPEPPKVPEVAASVAPPAPDAALAQELPPVPPVVLKKAAQPPIALPLQPRARFRWNRPAVIGPVAGLLAAAVIFFAVHQNRKRAAINAAKVAPVQVAIATIPANASLSVVLLGGGKPVACRSDCKLALTPGTYRISATLDGYEPAASTITVRAGQSTVARLALAPQSESVRLLSDLQQGKVVLDDRPPADLAEGQFTLDKLAPGAHTVRVIGKDADASFSFSIADARLPVIAGPVSARNIIAVVVASFGKQARIATNAGPWKLAVNGQAQGDVDPAGTEVTSFQPGVNEIVVGAGKDQRGMSESFGAAPTLTAFLKTDVNAGMLIVTTGLDGVSVFVNGKEYHARTQHGQLRIQTLGKVSVRAAKTGFLDEPVQTADVKKGAEVRLQFNLKPQPQFGSLEIRGAIAGTEILMDQKAAGTAGPDGLFSLTTVSPGDHTIELRRDQYVPKRLQRTFRAGQAVTLAAADVALTSANATVRFARSPASATVTYHRADEKESHEVRGGQIDLPPGTYTFSATAPGYTETTARLQLAAGESREVNLTLASARTAPTPAAGGMTEFDDAQGWQKDGDSWVHKGGGFVAYKLAAKGVFTFTVQLVKGGNVFRAGQIRWFLAYQDPKNYLLYEMDRKNFWAGAVDKGKRTERVKTPHALGNQKAYTIQIEIAPDHAVQKVRVGGEWKVLDTFTEAGRDFTQGKFGFLIPGNDEIAISDFQFQPK